MSMYAEQQAKAVRELLYRMLEAPTTQISPSWKEEIRPALVAPGCKTPDGCRENGCLGWCDQHAPKARVANAPLSPLSARFISRSGRSPRCPSC